MEKQITIKIDNKGHLKGTVGWLVANADHIKIGETKSGLQGAWLKDSEGKAICTLAIRNYFDDGKIAVVTRYNTYGGIGMELDFLVSDACFAKIRQLAKAAVEIMEEEWNRDESIELAVIQVPA